MQNWRGRPTVMAIEAYLVPMDADDVYVGVVDVSYDDFDEYDYDDHGDDDDDDESDVNLGKSVIGSNIHDIEM